jgi:photosystem II stability/assembly factor-like uncharacterized protein
MKCCSLLLVVLLADAAYSQNAPFAGPPKGGPWVDISAGMLQQLADQGKKIGFPGKTAGIAVDRTNGDVFLVVPDQGLWKSTDQGRSFARVDGGKIGGRCETGFALNLDPQGKRLACFMLDGPSAYTLDGGKTWEPMKGNGRGWDAGSVQWSSESPANIFALRHECGGEVFTSDRMGKNWNLKGKAFAAVGIFDASTLVATREKEKGIFRSADGGDTWQKVAEMQPAGRDIRMFRGVAYWTSAEGLLVSKDQGKTWAVQGAPLECSFGPYFGKDEKHLVVVGKKGFFETTDGAQTWQHAAPLPPGFSVQMPGWFLNVGWDPNADVFYASTMGKPAYKWQRR